MSHTGFARYGRLAVYPLLAEDEKSPPLKRVGFESGSFDGVRISGRRQAVLANPFGSGKVFRAYVPNSDERSEIALDRFLPGDRQWEGQTRWYAWKVFLPNDFKPSGKHTILAQWHRWQPGMNDRYSWAKGSPNVFVIDRQTGRSAHRVALSRPIRSTP